MALWHYTNLYIIIISNLHFQFSPSIKHATVVAQSVQCVGVLYGFPQPTDHVEPLAWLRVRLGLELHSVRPCSFRINQRQHQKPVSYSTSNKTIAKQTQTRSRERADHTTYLQFQMEVCIWSLFVLMHDFCTIITETGRFRGLAQNSTFGEKLWSLIRIKTTATKTACCKNIDIMFF